MRDRADLGKVDGTIAGMQALELGTPPRAYVFVASDKGDRLFRSKVSDESFEDVTDAAQLKTQSKRFAWIDLDTDGTPELVTWDGTTIRVWQFKNGAFTQLGKDFPLAGECLGLAACATKPGGNPAILVSAGDWPSLLHRDAAGAWVNTPLPGRTAAPDAGTVTCDCVVLDADHDGLLDILQPRSKGGLLWRGTAEGFAPPVATAVTCPDAPAKWCLGDFDGDGSIDLFLTGPKKNELWANDGKGTFSPVSSAGGTLGYKCLPGATFCAAMDLNHDGRTDLCLLYPKSDLNYHFNRGFRCFGEEGELRLTEPSGAPVATGQIAAATWDFNGDSSLDLAVALADGQIVCYYNAAINRPLLRVSAKPGTGPVQFSVWQGGKNPACLGAFITGNSTVLVPLRDPADCELRFQLPGRSATVKKVAWPKTTTPAGVAVTLEP